MIKILLFCLGIGLSEAGFFDLTDVDDPLSLLWHTPLKHKQYSECKIDDTRQGVCTEDLKCRLSGGVPKGRCGIIFTCCSYENTCNKITDKKEGYFRSENINPTTTKCRYTIKLRNKNVCQIRLDFEKFILSPTSSIAIPNDETKKVYSCATDELRISPDYYGIPVLCGNNTQQHVYVHVNQSDDNVDAVLLDINLASRLASTDLVTPLWHIKYTQLECPRKKHVFEIGKLVSDHELANDFGLLAPQGVLQYYTQTSGVIKSFAYEEGSTKLFSYPYSENYVIGFKRPHYICGIMFSVQYLNLYKNTDNTCLHLLYTPDLYQATSSSVGGDAVLGLCTGTTTTKFYSFAPGPFLLYFKAIDAIANRLPTGNQGFVLKYELQTCSKII
ncbi:hypothetical protein GWI33_000311 [Rhynchophorus ferrugineus]|uniref:CUB domain-containing protein n=1 Tax=Rhynchophorus ferrugineus TaxID=354439 RepID=A0A834HTC8_RHYFE|nr:hypothetical protein GWI33_000311 [Rhynchophorus ferrugineus]